MMLSTRLKVFTALAAALLPILLSAFPTGADPRLSGAPGDEAGACTGCHTGTALNGGPGSVRIALADGNTYTPGVKKRVTVTVSDSAQRRWGFELSARLASNLSGGQAGDLASSDGNTQVICDNGRPAPCASGIVQFITHTVAGTRNGTTGSASFEFDWTPPATASGNVMLYAAGNAANGDNRNSGDRIYTTSLEVTPAATTSAKPAVASERGVVNAASRETNLAAGSWVTITGTNLAPTTRTWTAEEIAGGKMPTALEGVGVTIGGKPAFVQFISPTQINVLAAADETIGPVEVRVTAGDQSSDPVNVTLQKLSPGFFTTDNKYLAVSAGENKNLDKSGRFFAQPEPATVKPGDTITLFGTGFGATDPVVAPGSVPETAAKIAETFTITIGGTPATVTAGELAAGLPFVYQFTVQVPPDLADGDHAVVAEIGGVTSTKTDNCCFLKVQK